MSESRDDEVAYHLLVDPDEQPILTRELRLLITDEAHEPQIRALARAVLDRLAQASSPAGVTTVALSPGEMKITYTALRLALDDTVREQAAERDVLRRLLDKLPDEHAIRAIELE
jgi:hypothetical protein